MKVLLSLLLFLLPFYGMAGEQGSKDMDVGALESMIEELKDQRTSLLAKAYRKDMYADRWQFEGRITDARKMWESAEQDRKIASEIEEKIDLLEKKKQELLGAE